MMKGKLKLAANKTSWLLVREDGKEMQVPPRTLSLGLYPLNPQKHDGFEVEYELEKGQPVKVREPGTEWQQQPPSEPAQARGRPQPGGRRTPQHENRGPLSPVRPKGPFHNPYNFVPAPPRDPGNPELGDRKPEGHDRYQPDLWSGRIAVKLVTQSPLLIHDAGQMELYKNDPIIDHKIFPVRLANGRPYLPPTSIKGMLRSAFEAVTNSRFGVFEKHQDRLAYRMEAKVGPVPARVEKRNGNEGLRIMNASVLGAAAKLPRYDEYSDRKDKGAGKKNVSSRYPNDQLPQHGDAVWVQLNENQVMSIERRTSGSSPHGNWKAGWACVTGPNINKKRFERVFLEGPKDPFIIIEEKHRSLWRELIQNYQDTHERELDQRRVRRQQPQDYLGDKPAQTGWSRHIYTRNEEELREGTLCYVEFLDENREEIAALIPVTISRRLYFASPKDLLPDSLKPAKDINELSPADRVFGWVQQSSGDNGKKVSNGPAAYKGNVRIGPVACVTSEPLEIFGHPGLPLAILGQPKPQQARFYVAETKKGEAQRIGISKEAAGYFSHKGLRGRKVYPHHADLPDTYWHDPLTDRTQLDNNGFFQEYRRSKTDKGERDDQNRSIKSWVRRQVTFEFEIDITNLTNVELGALLWLLTLPDDHFHRLGSGKPLGFGSVHLAVAWKDTCLHKGNWWRASYCKLDEGARPNANHSQIPSDLQDCINAFMKSVGDVYGQGNFDQVSFIAAFRRSAQGFADGKPLHYPRALQRGQRQNGTIPPHPEGKAFEWFVANERTGKQGGPKLSLPDLINDEGLPILEARSPGK